MTYYELATKAVEGDTTWNKVRDATSSEWYQLSQVSFCLDLRAKFNVL